MYYVSLFQRCMSTSFSSELTQQITVLTPCNQTGGAGSLNSFCVPCFPSRRLSDAVLVCPALPRALPGAAAQPGLPQPSSR